MTAQRIRTIAAAKLCVILGVVPVILWAYEYGPDPGYCGVPGENGGATCATAGCHTGIANSPANKGSVTVNFPDGMTYTPGVKQHLTVTISDPAPTQVAWGFELTARLASTPSTMAGSFVPDDTYTQLMCSQPSLQIFQNATQTCPAADTLQYIEHTLAGYEYTMGQGSGTYQFDWNPPSTNVGDIAIYVAGNAGVAGPPNQNGDHIYSTTYTLAPATSGACTPPLCVNSAADNGATPALGSLRYAVLNAHAGATITFDPALIGQTITLDTISPNNHIKVTQDVTIQGPGSGLLTISGGNATRIFFIAGGNVTISGLTLANGFAKGGNSAVGGGGGAAGMGGAVFLNGGALMLNGVALSGNRAQGGSGAAPGNGGGGGGGFGGDATGGNGANGGDLGGSGGNPGSFGNPGGAGGSGGPGAGGGGGGTGNGSQFNAPGGGGGTGGFGGGGGGGGLGTPHLGPVFGGNGGAGGFGGGGGAGGPSGGAAGNDGPGGFGGGSGGQQGLPLHANGISGGGAGLGGAIFVNDGGLILSNTTFQNDSTTGGTGDSTAANGQAKGGAIFICAPSFCGAGHNGGVLLSGVTTFQGNTAPDAGAPQTCPGRDDADICGALSAPTATRFSLSVPTSTLPGASFNFTVSAVDGNNNPAYFYQGKVHFSSTDPLAGLPPDTTLFGGLGTFPANLRTPGPQTITATDTATSSLTGTSSMIAVASTTPTHFSVSATASVIPGTPFNITVTALDANNTVVVVYSGKVHFTSSDPLAALPADATLSQGVGNFTATLATGPSQTITATDTTTPSITGTSNAIAASFSGVSLAAVSASPGAGSGAGPVVCVQLLRPVRLAGPLGSQRAHNNFLDGRQACYLAYVVPSSTLYLVDDAGSRKGRTRGGPGSPAWIQNSQCAVNLCRRLAAAAR